MGAAAVIEVEATSSL